MKLNKQTLRRIIKEELERLSESGGNFVVDVINAKIDLLNQEIRFYTKTRQDVMSRESSQKLKKYEQLLEKAKTAENGHEYLEIMKIYRSLDEQRTT